MKPPARGRVCRGQPEGDRRNDPVQGRELRVEVETTCDDEPATFTFTGKPDVDALKGEAAWEYQGMSGTSPCGGKREAARPKT